MQKIEFNGRKLTIEDAQIGLRNFAGEKTNYNNEGNRNFVVFLDEEDANFLADNNFNVKFPKERPDLDPEQDNRKPFIKVTIGNHAKVIQIVERADGEQDGLQLEGDEIGILQRADIAKVDLVINPWLSKMNNKLSAYLDTGYFVRDIDQFGAKYGIY